MTLRMAEEVSTQVPADDFQALEDKVYRTIELYKSAREARSMAERDLKRLREQLEVREEEAESLRREMVNLRKEREEIRARVSLSGPQRDNLHHRHAQIVVAGRRPVAPAAVGRLGLYDQIDRFPKFLFEFRVRVHAVHFRQRQCRQTVFVHGAGRNKPRLRVRGRQQVALAFLQHVFVRPSPRHVAATHVGEQGQGVHGLIGVPASVGLLLRRDIGERLVGRGVASGIYRRGRAAVCG